MIDNNNKTALAGTSLRRRTRPDLAAQQSRCDLNYLCLHRLLNGFHDEHLRVLYAPGAAPGQEAQLRIQFVERHRYTDTLRIELRDGGADGEITLIVQMYKDLRCAEVVRCNGCRLRARYAYPNARMFSPNEKSQLNRFLGEWLRHCMQRGYTGEVIPREAQTSAPPANPPQTAAKPESPAESAK